MTIIKKVAIFYTLAALPLLYRCNGDDSEPKCKDGNKTYTDGQSYTKGSFKYKCSANATTTKIVITACIWNRTGEEIQKGNKSKTDGYTAICKQKKDGRVKFIESSTADTNFEKKCKSGNKTYDDGEEYKKGNFKYKCSASRKGYKTEVIACVWDKTGEDIKVNETATKDGFKAVCKTTKHGKIKFKVRKVGDKSSDDSSSESRGKGHKKEADEPMCKVGDKKYKNGEEYKQGSAKYRCSAGPAAVSIEIIACVWERTGEDIRKNSTAENDQYKATCTELRNGTVVINEEVKN